MAIADELGAIAVERPTALTIGVFDGVHLGHARLMRRVVEEAARGGLLAGVVTFREHPAATLDPAFDPQYLTTFDDRLDLLSGLGIDFAVPITFDRALSRLSAAEFLSLLQDKLRMSSLVVGPDFAMGRGREGGVRRLAELADAMRFSFSVIDALATEDGQTVRSTAIRRALRCGAVERAAALLGRPFALAGVVVPGDGRGESLGFPTANIAPPAGMAVPLDGVYAAFARLGACRKPAAVSIGVKPTFGGSERAIEACILDHRGDLYGQTLRLEFVQRLRAQVKFDNLDDLLAQMRADVRQARLILQGESPGAQRADTLQSVPCLQRREEQ